jgi:UDP-glucuronate 4-epimerase
MQVEQTSGDLRNHHAQRRALVTGGAGFIGFHLARRLLADGWQVTSVDGITPYYDVALKRARLTLLAAYPDFSSRELLLEDTSFADAYADAAPDVVFHLAAQAGVRYSLENPDAYVDANLIGTYRLLELVRRRPPSHLLLASTSSVYGMGDDQPSTERGATDQPLTLYAATKKATEVIAHSYSHLWKVPTTVTRFYSVYGPWGRPDMALFKFTKAILAGEPIDIYGHGEMTRDFTFVDDVIEALVRLAVVIPVQGEPASPEDPLSLVAPYRVVNIGGGQPVGLMTFIEAIEHRLGRAAQRRFLPMQPGDVADTCAAGDLLRALTGYRPATPVDIGVGAFVDWYRAHKGVPCL